MLVRLAGFIFTLIVLLNLVLMFDVSISLVEKSVLDYFKISYNMEKQIKLVSEICIDFLNQITSLLPCHFSIEVSHFIACQFALESRFGTSPFAVINNNYCGMKVPALRLTLALNSDEKNFFARYSGITYCVHDYLIWLTYNKFTRQDYNNLSVFINHLKVSGYCTDDDYIEKINSIYNQYYSH